MKFHFVIYMVVAILLVMPLNGMSFKVQNYNPRKDHTAIMNLCSYYWQELNELDESCSDFHIELFKRAQQKEQEETTFFAKVLRENGSAIAFALYQAPVVHGFKSIPKGAKEAELLYLLIDPQYEGKGYSLILLNQLTKTLREDGFSNLLTSIKSTNYSLIDWFKRQGFSPVEFGKSETPSEEALRVRDDERSYTLLKLPLTSKILSTESAALSEEQQREVRSETAAKEIQKFENYGKQNSAEQLADDFVSLSRRQPLIAVDQLKKIITYYLYPDVERADVFDFAAYLLGKRLLSPQTRLYVGQVMNYVDAQSETQESLSAQQTDEELRSPLLGDAFFATSLELQKPAEHWDWRSQDEDIC